MKNKSKNLIKSYVKSFLFERGRFKNKSMFNAWLVSLDCTIDEFNDLFLEIGIGFIDFVPRNNLNSGVYIFQKNEMIMDYIISVIGEDNIDSVGGEFDDNLPLFICVNTGDFTLEKSKGKISLEDNLDWMVHDIWHRLVDFTDWYNRFINSNEDVLNKRKKYSMMDNIINHRDLVKEYKEDALLFLNYYNFTSGVGATDFLPSLAAFCVMRRDIFEVNESVFRSKMKDYDSFNLFFKTMYEDAPDLWNSLFNLFKGKIVCLNAVA